MELRLVELLHLLLWWDFIVHFVSGLRYLRRKYPAWQSIDFCTVCVSKHWRHRTVTCVSLRWLQCSATNTCGLQGWLQCSWTNTCGSQMMVAMLCNQLVSNHVFVRWLWPKSWNRRLPYNATDVLIFFFKNLWSLEPPSNWFGDVIYFSSNSPFYLHTQRDADTDSIGSGGSDYHGAL